MKRLSALAAVAGLAIAATALADHHEKAGIKAEMLNSLNGIEKKLVGLVGAMPEDKMSWRPMEGVRSYSEVSMHIAAANYFISGSLGAEMPAGLDVRSLEKTVTTKANVIEHLKQSMAHARAAIAAVPDGEMNAPTKLFGRDSTKGGAALVLVEHASEHMGQSIAYARMNKVVPPWSK